MNWIKCTDRLPENEIDVLVFNPKDGISIGEFDADEVSGYWEDDKSYCVTNSGWHTQYEWAPYMSPTHWMPLPEEPNDELNDLNKRMQEDYDNMVNSMWRPTPNKTI